MDHHWEEKPKKKKVTALNSVSKAKKQCNFGSGWLTAGNLKTNLKGSIFQEKQPNQFHCYNQSMRFVDIMDQNVAKYRIVV